jgi:CBS domain-containing protein
VRVDAIMSPGVITVSPEMPLRQVAEMLSRYGISGVPVCDQKGRVVGVVSETDIVEREQGLEPPHGLWSVLLERLDESVARLSARSAGEAMTSPAIAIETGSTVAEAARLMTVHQVNRLPVLRDGELVGIVTRADLVRAFHRSDEEIRREIEADVLHVFWVDPGTLAIDVEGGAVRLSGRVENHGAAELIVKYVRQVPGVVEIRDELSWDVDDLARRTAAAAENLPRRL